MRFKLDENFGSRCGGLLRDAGHDVETVREEALCGAADQAIFQVCATERRCLLTLDAERTEAAVMEKIVRKYRSYREMKADECLYWQSRPAHERMAAVSALTTAAYALKGVAAEAQRLQGPLIRLPRPKR